ncbi:OmpA family protein [Thermovibrio guaymasensis]|uniref:OmpA family protein n=1 Tax=Thermovibrio guaymasensis TaxID=240167 RepID=A0A420W575_9BACT|nr:OmpA family protein [Thermovibrio guaymasensis]RKQ59082.1 OmpA family protein [Thermovibrio guaymasensis]
MRKVIIWAGGIALLLVAFTLVSRFVGEKERNYVQTQKPRENHKFSISQPTKQGSKLTSKSIAEFVQPRPSREEKQPMQKNEENEGNNLQLRINKLQSQMEKVGFSFVDTSETAKIFKSIKDHSGKIIFENGELTVYLFAPADKAISKDKLEKIVFDIRRKIKSGNVIVLSEDGLFKVVTVYSPDLSKSLTPDQIVKLFRPENLVAFSSSRKIRFYFDKTEVITEDKPNINKLLSDLEFAVRKSGAKVSKIIVEGHTDSLGSEEYNLALSLRRAQILNDELRKRFKDVLIVNIGKGEKFPIDTNDTPEGRKNNRRIGVSLEFSL